MLGSLPKLDISCNLQAKYWFAHVLFFETIRGPDYRANPGLNVSQVFRGTADCSLCPPKRVPTRQTIEGSRKAIGPNIWPLTARRVPFLPETNPSGRFLERSNGV
jgi:hypothetical protein